MSKLKAVREAAGMSQGRLAEASGVNKQMICFYEQGVRSISGAKVSTVMKLAKALGCTVDEIVKEE